MLNKKEKSLYGLIIVALLVFIIGNITYGFFTGKMIIFYGYSLYQKTQPNEFIAFTIFQILILTLILYFAYNFLKK